MSLHKTIVILLALLLAAMAMVPMVSASTDTRKDVQQINAPEMKFKNFFVPEDMQKEIIKGIKDSDLTDKEKKSLIKTLNEIWTNISTLSDDEKEKVMIEVSSLLLSE